MAKIYGNTTATPINPDLLGGGSGAVDQTYNPESKNAQSGIAIHELIGDLPQENFDADPFKNLIDYIDTSHYQIRTTQGSIVDLQGEHEERISNLENSGGGSGGSITVDQTYNLYSENAQSGKAVAEALINYYTKEEMDGTIGDINVALGHIIEIQNEFISRTVSE